MFTYPKFAWLFLLPSFLVPKLVSAQYTEYEVKAAYLEKFTRFIEWPKQSALSDTTKPFILGILGDNSFGNVLEDIYGEFKIKHKKVVIQYYSNTKQIEKCNLLFISASEKKNLESIFKNTKGRPILTVSDSEGFAEKGVHINLYFKDNKLRYEINKSALIKSGFTVWAQLLSSAKIVNSLEK